MNPTATPSHWLDRLSRAELLIEAKHISKTAEETSTRLRAELRIETAEKQRLACENTILTSKVMEYAMTLAEERVSKNSPSVANTIKVMQPAEFKKTEIINQLVKELTG